jgi:hypothetical protein
MHRTAAELLKYLLKINAQLGARPVTEWPKRLHKQLEKAQVKRAAMHHTLHRQKTQRTLTSTCDYHRFTNSGWAWATSHRSTVSSDKQ